MTGPQRIRRVLRARRARFAPVPAPRLAPRLAVLRAPLLAPVLALLIALGSLSGCGQTGPLVLPADAPTDGAADEEERDDG